MQIYPWKNTKIINFKQKNPFMNYKQLQITQQELDTYIYPIMEALKAKKLDPMGIGVFRQSAIMGCKNLQIALDNYKTGLLKDRSIMISAITDAITRLATYRIMLERPERDIYEELTTYAATNEQEPRIAWQDVEERVKAQERERFINCPLNTEEKIFQKKGEER